MTHSDKLGMKLILIDFGYIRSITQMRLAEFDWSWNSAPWEFLRWLKRNDNWWHTPIAIWLVLKREEELADNLLFIDPNNGDYHQEWMGYHSWKQEGSVRSMKPSFFPSLLEREHLNQNCPRVQVVSKQISPGHDPKSGMLE